LNTYEDFIASKAPATAATAAPCPCRYCTSDITLHAALAEHGVTSREHTSGRRMWVRDGVDLVAMTARQGWAWLHDGAPENVSAWKAERGGLS
jgi:hypothetical protein